MKNWYMAFSFIFLISVLLVGCAGTVTPIPTSVDIVSNADKLFNEGKLEEAFSLYSQDIQNKNDLARAYAGRGSVYSVWRRFDEAISDFNSALNIVSTPEVLTERCNVYRVLSKFDLAEKDCKEAMDMKPDYPDIYIATALLQLEQNKNNDAYAIIQKGINQNPNYDKSYYALSQIELALGNLPDAFKALDKAIELKPKEAQYYCERGFLYYSSAQLDNSRQDYQKVIEIGIQGKDDECIYKAQGMLQMLGK